MANEVKKPQTEQEKAKSRVAARQATKAAEFKLRGGRELRPDESNAIRELLLTASYIESCVKSIREGAGFSRSIAGACGGLKAACVAEADNVR